MVKSPASDAVMASEHPSPENGGPCATCAFRNGTEANLTVHTNSLARLCVEGFRDFHCHEKAQLCRGYIAAVNLRGVPRGKREQRWAEAMGDVADILAACIDHAAAEDL